MEKTISEFPSYTEFKSSTTNEDMTSDLIKNLTSLDATRSAKAIKSTELKINNLGMAIQFRDYESEEECELTFYDSVQSEGWIDDGNGAIESPIIERGLRSFQFEAPDGKQYTALITTEQVKRLADWIKKEMK